MIEVLVIVVAIALGSFIKGVTGSGLPQVAIPVMASFFGIERAVVIMVVPGIVSNAWMLWALRGSLRRSRDLPTLFVVGGVGVVAGTWLLKNLDPTILAFALAAVVGLYVVMFLSRSQVRLPAGLTRWTSPPVGLVAGVLQGATGMSGPLVQTYLHAYRLDKQAFVVSTVALYGLFAVVQAAAVAGLDLYTPARLWEGLLALIPMAVMLPVGARVARHLSQHVFDRWVLVVLVVSTAKVLYDAVVG